MARRATAIKDIRGQNPNVLLLDAGNALTGQSLADGSKGRVVVEAMNQLGYTAMAIGERELCLGLAEFRKRMQEARFPFVSANVVIKATGKLLAEPYAIVEVGGIKVGILGLTNANAVQIPLANMSTGLAWPSFADEVIVTDPLVAAEQYVPEIAAKADLVIVLSHLGIDLDQTLVAEVPGIAVVVGGYSRTILSTPLAQRGALIVQAGYDGEYLGKLVLEIGESGSIAKHAGEIIALGPKFLDDPQMAQWLAEAKRSATSAP